MLEKLKNRWFGFTLKFGGSKKEPLRKRLKFWTKKIEDKKDGKS